MDFNVIFDYFLKWLIPFLCAGILTLFIRPIVNTFKQGQEIERQENWNRLSEGLKTEIANLRQEISEKTTGISNEVSSLRTEMAENTDGIRDAILDMHLGRLIADSKKYIIRGAISASELDDYQKKYQTYKTLGGNGHMDPWYPKVISLPIIGNDNEDNE